MPITYRMEIGNILLIISAIVAVLAVALVGAYFGGFLDPLVAPIVKYLFKAKAKAEEKALEAQGKKAGQDFLKSTSPLNAFTSIADSFQGELSGNQQADQVAQKGLGGLKNL